MRKIVILILTTVFMFAFCIDVVAHPGKTDKFGGHYDKSTGKYHYHHGYPAHQHTDTNGDGVPDCPYDYNDKTGQNSGTSSSKTSNYSYSSAATNPPEYYTVVKEKEVPVEVLPEWAKLILGAFAFICFCMFVNIKFKKGDIALLQKQLEKAKEEKRLESKRLEAMTEEKNELLLQLETSKTNAFLKMAMPSEAESSEIQRERNNRLELYKTVLNKALIDSIKSDLGEEYLLILSGAPSGTVFDDKGLPHKYENGVDIFMYAVSKTGKYHRLSCHYAYKYPVVHATKINKSDYRYSPCLTCLPILPDTKWFEKYKQYKQQLETPDSNWRDILNENISNASSSHLEQ